MVVCIDMTDFPTGLLVFTNMKGARWVRKTTTVAYCQAPCFFDWRGQDTIHLQDVRNGRANPYWSRTINMSRAEDPTAKQKESWTNITHLMGAAPLAGDEEYEIVLLQPRFTTPQSCELNNPYDNSPLFRFGRGLTAMALKGELRGNGDDLWKTLILEQGSARVNLAFEESFEVVTWAWLQIVGDLNADGIAEVVVTYLGQEASPYAPTTPNGRFRTHVVPVSGKDGIKLWGLKNPPIQGWGFVADMNPDYHTSVPYLALGTVDLPTAVPPGGRFPPKMVRLTVFDVHDGTTKWSYEEQFPQDSYISYDMSLNQYLSALAPHDWTGDGVKDLVTPSRYFEATGANQTLLATVTHKYQILDGVDGLVHKEFQVWGPAGMVNTCGQGVDGAGEPFLTVFSGHGRRYDVSRINITPDVSQHWRFALFNNPDIQSATLGTDIALVGTQCITTRHNTTIFALNLGLFSLKRGFEIMGPYGTIGVDPDDALEKTGILWVEPPVRGNPPMSVEEILKYFEVPETHPALMLAFTAGPAVPGLVAGLGLGRLRLRKGGSP